MVRSKHDTVSEEDINTAYLDLNLRLSYMVDDYTELLEGGAGNRRHKQATDAVHEEVR